MARPILLTRPEPGLQRSARHLRAQDIEVIELPLLRLSPVDSLPAAALKRARQAHWLIFTSRSAVASSAAQLPADPSGPRCAAVGQGTADELLARGWPKVLVPPDAADSESLLALPALQAVAGQHIVIVAGAGGRRLLGQRLRQRGARVDKLVCYRRQPVFWPRQTLLSLCERQPLLVITSGAALRQWDALTQQHRLPAARELDLLVASQRLCKLARKLGMATPIDTLRPMSDAALLRSVSLWQREQTPS